MIGGLELGVFLWRCVGVAGRTALTPPPPEPGTAVCPLSAYIV